MVKKLLAGMATAMCLSAVSVTAFAAPGNDVTVQAESQDTEETTTDQVLAEGLKEGLKSGTKNGLKNGELR